MHSSTLLLSLLSATTTFALPQPGPLYIRSSSAASQVALPASTLPLPAANLTLQYVTLGIGTQNYSCATTPNNASATPTPKGAKATLYDASFILSQGPPAMKASTEKMLPALALSLWETYQVTPDQWPAPMQLFALGHHFFSAAGVPTFVLDGASPKAQIQGKKTGNVAAPADACPGLAGEGAVDWLQLTDNGAGFSAGTVLARGVLYRVETAGGAAPKTCDGLAGDVIVKYAAEYFFYGPSS